MCLSCKAKGWRNVKGTRERMVVVALAELVVMVVVCDYSNAMVTIGGRCGVIRLDQVKRWRTVVPNHARDIDC